MKNFLNKLVLGFVMVAFSATAVMAESISPGDLQRMLGPVNAKYNLGGTTNVISGGTLEVKSGGTLKLDSGSTFTISNASSFAALGATSVSAGASGTAGNLKVYPATAANGFLELLAVNNTGPYNAIISNSNAGQTTTYSLPDCGAATCNFITDAGAQSIAGQKTFTAPVLGAATATSINKVAITAPASSATLTIANGKTLTVSNSLTLAGTDGQTETFPAVSDTIAGLGTAQTFTAAQTIGTGGSLVAKVSGITTDIDPAFSQTLLGNPVMKMAYGNATIADINAGTGTAIILTGATSRKIYVLGFDIVPAGSAATCTGIYLTDSSSVRVATMLAAQLTSGAHVMPSTGSVTIGVGFGGGSGLTSGASLQLLVDGSSCTTTTSVQYAILYTVQ